MGARYATTGQENAVTASNTTALTLESATTVRPNIYEIMIGQSGTPGDTVVVWTPQRFTVAPTVSAVVPAPLDTANAAAEVTGGENASAEGTYTSATEMFELPINQRASYRWVAAPGGEFIIPATAAAGIGVRVRSASYTGAAEASVYHEE